MSISPERIAQIERRRDEVQANMSRPDLPAEEFLRLSKEYVELEPVAIAAHEVRRLRQELKAPEVVPPDWFGREGPGEGKQKQKQKQKQKVE